MLKFNLFGRGVRLQIAITVACQMAFVLFGYDQGVFSGIVGNADWLDIFGHPGSGLEGIIVSFVMSKSMCCGWTSQCLL